ncbi:YggT family protein [Sphingomonas sp. LR60]|uniref:YggT family protein n=1 Tax=Sphingomonas sp. LR60 TaxID=3050233 RepID=UPI002FE2256F
MLTLTIIEVLQVILQFVRWIIIIQIILSLLISFNIVNTSNNFIRALYEGMERLSEPLYRPIRRMLPDTRGIDFAPMVVLLLIVILNIILSNIALSVATSSVAV